jgi:hypothetical protein
MKSLKQIIFVFAISIGLVLSGLTLSVPAQRGDDQKKPPKQNPPVIKPGEKPPPRGNEKPPKKP